MSSVLEEALSLASLNVRMIPVLPNAKTPALADWPRKASNDPDQIHKWFDTGGYNSGIVCGKISDGLWLVGVDVDNSPGKNGSAALQELDDLGLGLPDTWTQKTARGGFHYLYWSKKPIRQGTNILGPGIDIRCEGGQLVGPGSVIDGKRYEVINRIPFVHLPDWVVEQYKKPEPQARVIELRPQLTVESQVIGMQRALELLQKTPPTREGARNTEGFKLACRIKDFGLDISVIKDLLEHNWKCEPPLEAGEIESIVNSAFKTGKNSPGVDAPENIFDKVPAPPTTSAEKPKRNFIDEYNDKYFYYPGTTSGRVCFENGDELIRLSSFTFHEFEAADTMINADGKQVQKSKEWLKHPKRRTFLGVRFYPGEIKGPHYNIWKGFKTKVTPGKIYSEKGKLGFENFIKHCKENLCGNHEESFEWLMNFGAHLFQKPHEKPPVAVVFQGEKGTGKNVFIDVLKHMIGKHSVTIAGKHIFKSNFNSLLEDKLLIALDEAFWSGDKSVEGLLKYLITDPYRTIERKGEEAYETPVYDRIFILGNEDRLVNATDDERRFAIYNVQSHRRGDTDFFGTIMDGILRGDGDQALMEYFMSRDISKFNLRKAPETQGLIDQKIQSLSATDEWWMECLSEKRIIGNLAGDSNWPETMTIKECYEIFARWEKEKPGFKYATSVFSFGKRLRKLSPKIETKAVRQGAAVSRNYIFPPLDQAREDWNKVTKINTEWE